jgi:hypothetical protein
MRSPKRAEVAALYRADVHACNAPLKARAGNLRFGLCFDHSS